MTTTLIMIKKDGRLVCTDEAGQEEFNKLPNDKEFLVIVKVPRNIAHHRKFFALLHTLVENSNLWQNIDAALIGLKISMGLVTPVIRRETGDVYYIPESIAVESMDQTRFQRFYDRAINIICQRWLVGTEDDALRNEIIAMTADPRDRQSAKYGKVREPAPEHGIGHNSTGAAIEAANRTLNRAKTDDLIEPNYGIDSERDDYTRPVDRSILDKIRKGEQIDDDGFMPAPKPHDFKSYKFELERLWENARPSDETRLIEQWAKEETMRSELNLTADQRAQLKEYVLESRARLRK